MSEQSFPRVYLETKNEMEQPAVKQILEYPDKSHAHDLVTQRV